MTDRLLLDRRCIDASPWVGTWPLLGGVLFLLASSNSLSAQVNTVLTTSTCPVCTAAQESVWRATHYSTLRAVPRDMLGHRIGTNRAERASGTPKWEPLHPEKQVACGRFQNFSLFTDYPEWDWNIRVTPTEYSKTLFEAAKAGVPEAKIKEWPCKGECFKGEITTDNGFFDNPYFWVDVPNVTVSLPLGVSISYPDRSRAGAMFTVGDTLCMYGPWVKDMGHDFLNHPEIHPSEVVWWRDNGNGALYVLLLQDDSNRFDRRENFEITDEANWSRPWSAFPRWTDLRVSFAADASGTNPGHITVDNLERQRILTRENSAASRDSDDGSAHALEFDGKVVLHVTELETPSDRIGVTFVDVCRLPADRRNPETLIGFVSFNTVIGDSDRGDGGDSRDEGFYVLRIDLDEPMRRVRYADLPEELTALRRWRSRSIPTPDSVRRFTPDRRKESPGQNAPTYSLSASSVRRQGSQLITDLTGLQSGGTRESKRNSVTGRLSVRGSNSAKVPMARGGTLVVRTQSNDSIVIRLPALTIAPVIATDSIVHSTPDPQSARDFAAAVRPRPNGGTLGRGVMRTDQRLLEIVPAYVPTKTDTLAEAADDDEDPLASALNAAIRSAIPGRAAPRVVSIYGNRQPFVVSWQFTARNLVSGASTRVVQQTSSRRPEGIIVRVSDGAFRATRLSVQFPQQGLHELTAMASITDPDGIVGRATFTLQSHTFDGSLRSR